MQTNVPRPEYPRPQFVREPWVNLNGTWTYTFDFGKSGKERGLAESRTRAAALVMAGLVFSGEMKIAKPGQQLADDPRGLWRHIASRLPLGRPEERDAGGDQEEVEADLGHPAAILKVPPTARVERGGTCQMKDRTEDPEVADVRGECMRLENQPGGREHRDCCRESRERQDPPRQVSCQSGSVAGDTVSPIRADRECAQGDEDDGDSGEGGQQEGSAHHGGSAFSRPQPRIDDNQEGDRQGDTQAEEVRPGQCQGTVVGQPGRHLAAALVDGRRTESDGLAHDRDHESAFVAPGSARGDPA